MCKLSLAMDNDKLLQVIYSKPALWDRNNQAYYNRDLKRILWREVAIEMGTNYQTVRQSLRRLRTCFITRPDLRNDILCFEYFLAMKNTLFGLTNTLLTTTTTKRKTDTEKEKIPEKIKVQILEATLEDDRDDYYSCEYTTRPIRTIAFQ